MEEDGDVLGHVQWFNPLSIDLFNLGEAAEEEDKSLMLLCSLSESYDPLVMTLLYGKEILVKKECPISQSHVCCDGIFLYDFPIHVMIFIVWGIDLSF